MQSRNKARARTRRGPGTKMMEALESRVLLAATKIMPLGDSITEALSGHNSYRYWLWNQLSSAGYEVDFIGSKTGINGGSPPNPNFDLNHEGHSGFRADQIQSNITSWASANKPDVVLLHIGTNDISQGQSNSSTAGEIGGIIDNLRAVVPNVKILLAQIIPNNISASLTTNLNGLIANVASQKHTAQSPVVLVDQHSGFSLSADTYDGIHPDESGEQKIATKWFNALTSILPAPQPPPAGTYLSSLNWTSMSNGWGPAEKDRSNGEMGAGDGGLITLNGVTYNKGIGVHAGSDIRYNIAGGNYSEFRADIGLDDEVGNNGSVVFRVYVDNVLKYDSGTMTGASATKQVAVSVVGASQLRLVVTDAGDGNGWDHADWANARLIAGEPVTPPAAPSGLGAAVVNQQILLNWTDASNNESGFRIERKAGSSGAWSQIAEVGAGVTSYTDTTALPGTAYTYRVYAFNAGGSSAFSAEASATIPLPQGQVYLSDLNWTSMSNAWGPAEKDRNNGMNLAGDGGVITLNGVTYAKGLGVHANSSITYNLNGQYTQFLSDIGLDDAAQNPGSVVFQVYVDNVLVYTSPTMTGNSATQQVNVNVAGAQTLRLVVTDAGNGGDWDWADWANARLIAGAPVSPPAAPNGLVATFANGQTNLSWSDGSNDENGFRIQRKLGAGGAWTTIHTVAANVTNWTDSGPFASNSTYYYRILAFNVGGESAPSNERNITTPQVSTSVWLSDLNWSSAQNGWGAVEKDRSNGEQGAGDGGTLSIRGQTYAKGLGIHANSQIVYNLGGQYTTFASDIGLDDETLGNGTVEFQVYVDGVIKYTSGVVTGIDAVKQIAVNVAGAQQLMLVVTNAGDGADWDHANWAGARLTT